MTSFGWCPCCDGRVDDDGGHLFCTVCEWRSDEDEQEYPCACKAPDDLDSCMEKVASPDALCEYCVDCRQPGDAEVSA